LNAAKSVGAESESTRENYRRPLIGVIDYGMGNLHSALKGLQKGGAAAYLLEKPSDAKGAAGLVLPGVGHFGKCIENLRAAGFDELVTSWIDEGKPFLGICLGLQMLYSSSEEAGEAGLGIVDAEIVRLPSGVRVPHMGWNTVTVDGVDLQESRAGRDLPTLRSAVEDGSYFYFVHSYVATEAPADADFVLKTDYGLEFVSGFQRGNLWATQFHPEKSGMAGISLLENFVRLCSTADLAAEAT
jgi:glutamine amidotransferase